MALRFIFIACLSVLVGRVSSSKNCPGNTDHIGPLSYETALTNSVNKFIKNLRDGTSNLGMRLVNTVSIDNSTTIDVSNPHGNMSYHLEWIWMAGFSDLNVTDARLNSDDSSPFMRMSFSIEIPQISVLSDYTFFGKWNEEGYQGHKQMYFHYDTVRTVIRIKIKLTEDREHWELEELRAEQRNIYANDEQLNFGYPPIDDVKIPHIKILKEQVAAKLERVLAKHLKTILRKFLRELFEKIRWYAIIFGRFDPDDHELYDE